MVERKMLCIIIIRLTGKQTDLLAEAAINHKAYRKDKINTSTFDSGLECAQHEVVSKGLDAYIYLARSRHHGSVELMKVPTV